MTTVLNLFNRDDYCDYVELCFWEFGDRVKHWITFNEPWSYSCGGYAIGTFAPGRGATASKPVKASYNLHRCHGVHENSEGDPATEPYLVTHNQILAHAAAVKLYKEKYQVCIHLNSYFNPWLLLLIKYDKKLFNL